MSKKRGNVITLSGIGQMGGTMSRATKIGLGLLLTGGAVVGGILLVKDIKKDKTAETMGRLGYGEGAVLLGDHNSRVMMQYEQRQRQIGQRLKQRRLY